MRKGILSLAAVTMVATLGLSACGGDDDNGGTGGSTQKAKGKVGVILPDTKSSVRYESFDRPYLEAAFKAAGIPYDIQNAENSTQRFQTIADQMITSGATVLLIDGIDSESAAAVTRKAQQQGVKTIDYDRLTLGGGAAYYVSFDNTKVGTLQGEGLSKCLTDKKADKPIVAYLNGSPTDNNATLFKDGYDGVLKPKFDGGEYVKGPDQAVPDWDNAQGGVIFEQLLTAAGGQIDGVLVANDGLSLAAQAVLADAGLSVPTTGQDATVDGLRAILQGTQCMTVYKPVIEEAKGAVAAAAQLLKGEAVTANATIDNGKGEIPYVQAEVQSIFIDQVKDVVADGFVSEADLCAGIEDLCEANGITAG